MLELASAPIDRRTPAVSGMRSLAPEAGGLRWHVDVAGSGPTLLLLHGTGSAARSWRGVLPELACGWTVIAPDLPGHGQSSDPGLQGLSLLGMAREVRALLDVLGAEPQVVIGHSAGAALACRMCLDGQLAPAKVISLNGALLPPLGMPLEVFSPLARLLAALPLVPRLLAMRARDAAAVERLIRGTGSWLDSEGLDFYGTLLRDPRHVSAALRMMAVWDLPGLARDLPALKVPLDLIVADGDRTIAPSEAGRVRELLPHAHILYLAKLGHLAHEEDPEAVLAVLRKCLATVKSNDQKKPPEAGQDVPPSERPQGDEP